MDTVIFPLAVEETITAHVTVFRPILAAQIRARGSAADSSDADTDNSSDSDDTKFEDPGTAIASAILKPSATSPSSASDLDVSGSESGGEEKTVTSRSSNSMREETTALFVTSNGTPFHRLSDDIESVIRLVAPDKHISITTLRKVMATEGAQSLSSSERQVYNRNDTHRYVTGVIKVLRP